MLAPMRSLFLLVLAACNSSPAPTVPPPPASIPPVASKAPAPPPMAPTPYTADQIRAACPAGRTITFKREVKGAPVTYKILKFVTSDEAGADVESTTKDAEGKIVEAPSKEHSTWEELRQHAEFPKPMVTIADGTAETPAGKFPSHVYTVVKGDETMTFYFAVDRPGPPVLFFSDKAGERVMTSTLVDSIPVACKTDDDCWMDADDHPIARPKEQRGRKLRPCHDRGSTPACDQNTCVVRHWKC